MRVKLVLLLASGVGGIPQKKKKEKPDISTCNRSKQKKKNKVKKKNNTKITGKMKKLANMHILRI